MPRYRKLAAADASINRDKAELRDFLPALALLFVSTFGIFIANFIPFGTHTQYAVLAPFSYNLAQTAALVARAGGEIVDVGGLSNVIIAHSSNPSFVETAYRSGALLVVDPKRLSGCGDGANDADMRSPSL